MSSFECARETLLDSSNIHLLTVWFHSLIFCDHIPLPFGSYHISQPLSFASAGSHVLGVRESFASRLLEFVGGSRLSTLFTTVLFDTETGQSVVRTVQSYKIAILNRISTPFSTVRAEASPEFSIVLNKSPYVQHSYICFTFARSMKGCSQKFSIVSCLKNSFVHYRSRGRCDFSSIDFRSIVDIYNFFHLDH